MMPMLGQDNVIHACDYSAPKISVCKKQIPTKIINPDFSRIQCDIIWCYECSQLMERQYDN